MKGNQDDIQTDAQLNTHNQLNIKQIVKGRESSFL